MRHFELLGTRINLINKTELQQKIVDWVMANQHAMILNVNLHCLNLCYEQPALKSIFNQADIVFCDGFGVRLFAWLQGVHVPPRVTYADWIWELANICQQQGLSLYFLGSKPDVARRAARRLQERFPELAIVGCHHGHFDHTAGSKDSQEVIAAINQVKPDVLLIGLGMPTQEYWLDAHWPLIQAHIALSGGGVFDYVSGDVARAPRWLVNYGFEWLGRLIIEPRRLWRRYLLGLPKFLWRYCRCHVVAGPN